MHVRNITDAGHLENDADEGEDKIAKKARLYSRNPWKLYNIIPTLSPSRSIFKLVLLQALKPRVTGHIIEQEMVKKIL